MAEKRVLKYFGFRMSVSAYKTLQLVCITFCVVATVALYLAFRNSSHTWVRWLWALPAFCSLVEVIETIVMLNRAHTESPSESGRSELGEG